MNISLGHKEKVTLQQPVIGLLEQYLILLFSYLTLGTPKCQIEASETIDLVTTSKEVNGNNGIR